jgi:putative salt-induced outer membrane protein YdiY
MKFRNLIIGAAAAAFIPSMVLAQAAPRTVRLVSGEQVTGKVVEQTETKIVVDSAGVGVVTIDRAKVAEIIGPTGAVEAYTVVPEPGLFGTDILSGYTKVFEFGLNGQSGNSENINFNTALTFNQESKQYRTQFGANYFLSVSDGSETRNEFNLYGNRDWFFANNDRLFVFTSAGYQLNEFTSWYQRVYGYIGPGYDFIKKDNYTLTGRAGIGAAQDFGNEATDDFRIEAFLGLDVKWKIDASQTFVFSSYLYPSLEDFNDGRWINSAAYVADINRAKGIALKLGGSNEYLFRTADDSKPNTWKYFANILVKF